MGSIKESALAAITTITQSDLIRAVTAAGASRRITVANLAKAIIENYTGSSLAGSSQSVKAALDSLNSKLLVGVGVSIPENSDLNDFKTPGIYRISGTSVASSTANIPKSQAGKLIVMNTSNANYIIQEYQPYNAINEVYRRRHTDSWSVWYVFAGTAVQ